MVRFIKLITLVSILLSGFSKTIAANSNEINDHPLAKRCLDILETYKAKDLSAFMNNFSDKWIELQGKDSFKERLDKKHNKYMADYNGVPKAVLIKSIENVKPHPKEVEHLGVEESKEVNIYIKGDNVSRSTFCKFNRVGSKWFVRSIP